MPPVLSKDDVRSLVGSYLSELDAVSADAILGDVISLFSTQGTVGTPSKSAINPTDLIARIKSLVATETAERDIDPRFKPDSEIIRHGHGHEDDFEFLGEHDNILGIKLLTFKSFTKIIQDFLRLLEYMLREGRTDVWFGHNKYSIVSLIDSVCTANCSFAGNKPAEIAAATASLVGSGLGLTPTAVVNLIKQKEQENDPIYTQLVSGHVAPLAGALYDIKNGAPGSARSMAAFASNREDFIKLFSTRYSTTMPTMQSKYTTALTAQNPTPTTSLLKLLVELKPGAGRRKIDIEDQPALTS